MRRRGLFVALMMPPVALFLWLGQWQMDRRLEKITQMVERHNAQQLPPVGIIGAKERNAYQKTLLVGRFDHSREMILENQRLGETVGVRLITPFILYGGRSEVIVDRGWIPRPKSMGDLAAYHDGAPQSLNGILTPFPQRKGLLKGPIVGAERGSLMFLDPNEIRRPPGMNRARQFYVVALESRVPAVKAGVPEFAVSPERHLAYAVTWFALAALTVLMCLGVLWRGRRAGADLATR